MNERAKHPKKRGGRCLVLSVAVWEWKWEEKRSLSAQQVAFSIVAPAQILPRLCLRSLLGPIRSFFFFFFLFPFIFVSVWLVWTWRGLLCKSEMR